MNDSESQPSEVSRRRRRFQFSLARLMVVVTGVSVLCGLAVWWPAVLLLAVGPVSGLVAMRKIELTYLGDAALASGVVTCIVWAVWFVVVEFELRVSDAEILVSVITSFLGSGIMGFYAGAFLGGATAVVASLVAMCWRWMARLPED